MLDLSIIIVNFNTKDLLKSCVESIHKSNPKINFEVVVVDNGSKDGSLKVLKDLWREKKIEKHVVNAQNLGFSKANNIGIKESKGEHVLLLNSDTLVKKGALDKLVDFANKKSDIGVVGARLLNEDGSKQASCLNFPTIKNAIKEFWLGVDGAFTKYLVAGVTPVTVDAVVGAAFLITPEALEKVGGLNERFFFYYEDLDYCKRVRDNGLKVYYLPKAEIVHIHGASRGDMKLLIESSISYHGLLKHYVIQSILWSGQKWQKLLKGRS